jgi:hypothetical protein
MTKYMTQEIYDNIDYLYKSQDSNYFMFRITNQQIIFDRSIFDIIAPNYNLSELQFEVENNELYTELIFKFPKI